MSQGTSSNIIIKKIIEEDVDDRQIAREFPWTSLSSKDKEALVSRISTWDDPKVNTLFRYVFNALDNYIATASGKIDFPLHTKALISAFSNPQFKNISDKLEKNCSDSLSGLRDQIKDSGADDVIRLWYQVSSAEFYNIKANKLSNDGRLQEAKSSYEVALKFYNQIQIQNATLAEKKQIVQQYIEQIESLISKNMQIGSIDSLRNERLELLEEVRHQTDSLKQITKEYKSLQTKIKEGEYAILQIKSDFIAANKDLKSLQEKIKNNESAIQFLVELPQLIMSPLWVEVVRLALDKGEIDEFTKKCIEVLRVSYPKDAIPLLMEIVVRTPTSIPLSNEAAQFGMENFSTLMEEAHSLEATDELQAAKKLIEAWNVFHTMSKSIGKMR